MNIPVSINWNTILFFIFAYILGGQNAAYYYARFIKKTDIRNLGSKNPGALNSLMVFGKKAFIAVFIFDFLKGAVVVWTAKYFSFSEAILLIALFLAVLGHMYPVQMHFQGGKGISTLLGGITVYDYRLLIILIFLFVIIYPFIKKFSISGLIAILLLIFASQMLKFNITELIFFFFMDLLLIHKHKFNIKDYI